MMISGFFRCPDLKPMYVLCTMLGFIGSVHAQQAGEKLVQANDVAQITAAVMISGVTVNGNAVECGLFIKPPAVVQPVTPFRAGNGWLQQMAISLINRTNKTIAFGAINLTFLDTGDCHGTPCVGYSIRLGQVPMIDDYSARTGQPLRLDHPERPPLNWGPGQTIVVHMNEHMSEIEERLANHLPVTDITRVAVHIGTVFFDDGMKWLGFYYVPDPGHPGKFNRLPDDYFPGRRGHNWPPGYNQ